MGVRGSTAYTLLIACPAIAVSPASFRKGTRGVQPDDLPQAAVWAPYTFAVTSGSLPVGLTLSSGGLLSGTPTIAGTSSFT